MLRQPPRTTLRRLFVLASLLSLLALIVVSGVAIVSRDDRIVLRGMHATRHASFSKMSMDQGLIEFEELIDRPAIIEDWTMVLNDGKPRMYKTLPTWLETLGAQATETTSTAHASLNAVANGDLSASGTARDVVRFAYPVWPMIALMAVLPAVSLACWCWGMVHKNFTVAGRCTSCGYDLRATPDRCPECGSTSAKALSN